MPRYSPLYQRIMASAAPSIHAQFSGRTTQNVGNMTIIREEGCDDKDGEAMYACMVRKLQLKESKARLLSEETKKATSGAKQGLQVILDQNSNLDGIATHFDTDNSFKVYIGQPTAFPMLTRDPLTLSTGKITMIESERFFYRSPAHDPSFCFEFDQQ